MVHSASATTKTPKFFAGSGISEVRLDQYALLDVYGMLNNTPISKVAIKSIMARVFTNSFTFSIPAMGLESNAAMDSLIEKYWMPWCKEVFIRTLAEGICPYYFKVVAGHPIPKVPGTDKGYTTVSVNEKTNDSEYKWYYTTSTQDKPAPEMYWITTADAPDCEGNLRSPLATLLSNYRSLLKLQRAQDVCVTQSSRPIHIVEDVPSARSATDAANNMASMEPGFSDAAAGISKLRREAEQNMRIRARTAELYRHFNKVNEMNKVTPKKTLFSDLPEDLADEVDAGWGTRVVAFLPGKRYVAAKPPTMVGDYYKALAQFNMEIAAVIGFSIERLTPTGSARSQNAEAAADFENDRIRDYGKFFQRVIQTAIVIGYKQRFAKAMNDARMMRINNLHEDPDKISVLYPELDVEVTLASTLITNDAIWEWAHTKGLMTKETMGRHVFKNNGIPEEEMVVLDKPDKTPVEMIEGWKPQKVDVTGKPPRKKQK